MFDEESEVIENLRGRLHHKGRLLVTVPAYKFLWSNHDILSKHVKRYNKKEIINLVKSHGMKVLYCSYFNSLLFPLIAIIRLLKNLIGDSSSDNNLPNKFLNKILLMFFSLEKNLLPFMVFPFGVSIILLAEKE